VRRRASLGTNSDANPLFKWRGPEDKQSRFIEAPTEYARRDWRVDRGRNGKARLLIHHRAERRCDEAVTFVSVVDVFGAGEMMERGNKKKSEIGGEIGLDWTAQP